MDEFPRPAAYASHDLRGGRLVPGPQLRRNDDSSA